MSLFDYCKHGNQVGTCSLCAGPRKQTLEEQFLAFHKANPHVYRLFCEYAEKAIRAGRTRYSARTIWHVMRWHADFETTEDEFKLNDHHTPFYARMWTRDHPHHPELFELRVQKSTGGEA